MQSIRSFSRFPAFATLALLAMMVLAACAPWQPTLDDPEIAEQVRAPEGGEEPSGLQVYPLRNPAVRELESAAEAARENGDFDRAEALLERALRIEDRDPELLQRMAELQLSRGRWEQAESYARRSWELGPQVGDICRRNWRTMALARERDGQVVAAARARERVEICPLEPPERY
ncbi:MULTISPECIES: tetratricopeptide repeat protein [unclassified Wenzhouxiangella]|uniref:tetratricopeptide repeat protein n=1 Tax=unclassified Wenzhouxiangella TaxID=2613841 RepID=UPI000E329725|nr:MULTISPECIES: tetratricopeptide repeat protein [unclassified Wenzhouxiangella]RFF28163.1 tetratricopeptide repeat protein [Wenzhouxiangella sp. 15181]RFP67970.1 tetratricopeptide repeat protein [Wenzhouxiangella sp. 15190]